MNWEFAIQGNLYQMRQSEQRPQSSCKEKGALTSFMLTLVKDRMQWMKDKSYSLLLH